MYYLYLYSVILLAFWQRTRRRRVQSPVVRDPWKLFTFKPDRLQCTRTHATQIYLETCPRLVWHNFPVWTFWTWWPTPGAEGWKMCSPRTPSCTRRPSLRLRRPWPRTRATALICSMAPCCFCLLTETSGQKKKNTVKYNTELFAIIRWFSLSLSLSACLSVLGLSNRFCPTRAGVCYTARPQRAEKTFNCVTDRVTGTDRTNGFSTDRGRLYRRRVGKVNVTAFEGVFKCLLVFKPCEYKL